MERVLRDWKVLPEGAGALEDDHLLRRYRVFQNIDFGDAPSQEAIQAFRDRLLPHEARLAAT
jgi:hypothetical protein